ncbi:OPT family oligopeptide transporter [Asaia krungthepensis]|uniref:Oligopeptide transporter membrane spanning protein n=1 Tax=Asaia krungthepensis NRIC 0535 TaxID=1307925 RepID=A0ABQ0Q1Y6_9PROT|nr:oligopeptide transporter, OPT family [Asaia krungthepensis]GBQ87504.1 oligopeptide transporter membrane spanning protein [Asaia krungthepensis NRIC 0535]
MNQATRELTIRGLILGTLITVIFTASNVYLGLKIGLTFASSIPATVISMAVLRALGGNTILENNLVQTQASAAGTLSCVFATIPGLVMIGFWSGFPFWQSFFITLLGGATGVLFTIPLRRALVTHSALPYPEGVACAEILRVASPEGNQQALSALMRGSAIAAALTFLSTGLRVIRDGWSATLAFGPSIFRVQGAYSLALVGTGYLVGLTGGLAMLGGVIIGWGIAVPWLSAITPHPAGLDNGSFATGLWVHKVRFMGAGTIAIAACWTVFSLLGPVSRGLREAFSQTHRAALDETDRDLPPPVMNALLGALILGLGVLFSLFLWPVTSHNALLLVMLALGLGACLFIGFLVASACGYMAGIIGSSSSPISGISIISVVALCMALMGLEALHLVPDAMTAHDQHVAIAYVLFVLTALTGSAAISNDNLQDLKTGQIVGASPWKQEVVLLIGCVVGALVIPPVLNVLYQAYGFVGTLPRPGMDPSRALAAPQPALMVDIARGILLHDLDWTMILIGAAIGVALILIDRLLKLRKLALPPLAVGMGIYLPADVSVTIAIGAVIGRLFDRMAHPQSHGDDSTGTMIASGFIVGESLVGVVIAVLSGMTGHGDLLAIPVGDGFSGIAGIGAFALCLIWFALALRKASRPV